MVAGGASTLMSASGCATYRYLIATSEGSDVVVPTAGFDAHPSVVVEVDGLERPLFVHRHEDGSYTAVTTRCSHQGCQVEPAGGRLECPCHGSRYTLGGALLEGPADRPLELFHVRVEGDVLRIRLEGVGP